MNTLTTVSGAASPAARVVTPANIAQLDFAKSGGLLPAVVQDDRTGTVLMLAYMNHAALSATLARGRAVFFSRSKQRLWEKGETSGNTLFVSQVLSDCDRDSLLVLARPTGVVCHTGTHSCFGDAATEAEPLSFLGQLESVIGARAESDDSASYTAKLLRAGTRKIAQKVGEEAVEVALAATGEDDDALCNEAADLIFHLLVLLKSRALALADVTAVLAARHAAAR